MKTRTYLRQGRDLIRLEESTSCQRKNLDRIIVDKDFNVIKEITHDELMQLDRQINEYPVEPLLVGTVVPILRELNKQNELKQIEAEIQY